MSSEGFDLAARVGSDLLPQMHLHWRQILYLQAWDREGLPNYFKL